VICPKDCSITLVLNVNKFNIAFDFYKKNGFGVTNEIVIEIGNGYVMDDFEIERII
jgi:diamine N-acetyltransferase